jgi:hypothetical protein
LPGTGAKVVAPLNYKLNSLQKLCSRHLDGDISAGLQQTMQQLQQQ